MSNQSSRLKILRAEGSDDANVPLYTNAIADRVDAEMVVYSTGTLANRPVSTPAQPGIDGRLYYARDEGRLYVDTGTGWVVIDGGLPGEIRQFAGPTAPTGWLMCDGAAISRSTYAALFGVLGTTYGPGDGASTFNLPDLRDRVPMGASGTRPRGTTGGAETVVLSGTEMPPHNHGGLTAFGDRDLNHNHGGSTGNNTTALNHNHGGFTLGDTPDHSHAYTYPAVAGMIVGPAAGSDWWLFRQQDTQSAGASNRHFHAIPDSGNLAHAHGIPMGGVDHRHAITTQGGGAAHNNLQPFLALAYIIKTGA